jgi:hypothetical protein
MASHDDDFIDARSEEVIYAVLDKALIAKAE